MGSQQSVQEQPPVGVPAGVRSRGEAVWVAGLGTPGEYDPVTPSKVLRFEKGTLRRRLAHPYPRLEGSGEIHHN